ncbi:hypothetical protein K0504_05760 [Neiella marina]|uniref:Uncharacterized protein n=1 Tax=Neiella holothuriorum TaxID=2870530 RepID=A0ABS7EFS5_9GAMM|nr:hypothetical protein [Neiella holothuriorum]MBW8190537.1 hypothetical protein [Neiella holothuriorum]
MAMHFYRYFFIASAVVCLQGCSSVAKGVTEAVLEQDKINYQRRCQVYGETFKGLSETWANQNPYEQRELRVLVIHGAGNYPSGYADAMSFQLARRMGLTRVDARPRKLALNQIDSGWNKGQTEQSLGQLNVLRFRNAQDNRQLLVFELSWTDIAAADKAKLAFDESTAMTSQRVMVNRQLKEMVNMHASDPMIYMGPTGERIRQAVDTATCLMTISRWEQLQPNASFDCQRQNQQSPSQPAGYAVITHSMGSRIIMDVIQRAAENDNQQDGINPAFKNQNLNIYMLSNQLQLFQLGRPEPDSKVQTGDYCTTSSADYDKRLVNEMRLVSITDPNDVFSYTVPQTFVDEFIDARLCPKLVNVVTEVAAPINVFGLTQVAEPMAAHKDYFTDSKVLDVMVFGLAGAMSSDEGHEGCEWHDVVN